MDKTDRLLEAIEHPERYSDMEIDALMKDPEVRAVYDIIAKSKDYSYKPVLPDIDKEWEEFAKANKTRKWRFGALMRRNRAAIIIGIIATLAAVAAGISLTVSHGVANEEKTIVAQKEIKEPEHIVVGDASDEVPVSRSETIVFKEETLERILGEISEYYGAKTEFRNDEMKGLRLHVKWDQNKTLEETVEMLNNFEQINITIKGADLIVE